MGLWVYSQDKTKLFECNRFEISKYGNKIIGYPITPITTLDNYDLGMYSSKEKALEVLNKLRFCVLGFPTKEYDVMHDCPLAGIEFHGVFNMPEDEV